MRAVTLLLCLTLCSLCSADDAAPAGDAQTAPAAGAETTPTDASVAVQEAEAAPAETPSLPTITDLVRYPRTVGCLALIYSAMYQSMLNQGPGQYGADQGLDPYGVVIIERSDLENDIWHILPTGRTRQLLDAVAAVCPGVGPKLLPLPDGTTFIRYIFEDAFPGTSQYTLGPGAESNQARMSKRFIISVIATRGSLAEPGMAEWLAEYGRSALQ